MTVYGDDENRFLLSADQIEEFKNEIVKVSEKIKNPEILEAKFNQLSNHHFHKISDEVIREIGLPLGERVFPIWQKWFNEEVKKH